MAEQSSLTQASHLLDGVYLEDLCAAAHQAAEKAIRAVLLKRAVDYPYVHDLGRLLALAASETVRGGAHEKSREGMSKEDVDVIISRTPLRISFVGGGTDLPAFYRDHEGAVLSSAIDKYIFICVNAKFDRKIRVSYSTTEIVETVDQLRHELVREALDAAGIDMGIEIASISDVPSHGTGLGSSSAYTVGLLNALRAYQGKQSSAEWLAKEACKIEIDRCRKPIGKQDQYIAAFGGMKFIRFLPSEQVVVDPVACQPETKGRLERNLLLLYTGIARESSDILEEQSRNTRQGSANARALAQMAQQAYDLRDALEADRLDEFGEILHAGWQLKRQLAAGITSQQIDSWYETARANGAGGGKLLGAGGGGFLLLYAPPERHARITDALPELRRVSFSFSPEGSRTFQIQ